MTNDRKNPQLFWASKFISELEINNFFKSYLSDIFPHLTHIQSEWPIPEHDPEEKDSIIDALVFHHENGKKNGKIRGVFLEYKYRSDRNPIDQIKKYYQILKGRGRTANYLKLEKKYKEKFPKTNTEWKDDNETIKIFFQNIILICIVDRFSFYKISAGDLIEKADNKENDICLIEVRKYENEENGFILVSLINRDKTNRKKWKSLLGMKKKSVIVMVPKKEKTEIYSKTKTLQEKPPKKLEIAETETENREKNDAETYITEWKVDNPIQQKRIREIDKKIKITNKQIKSGITENNKHLTYYKEKNPLIRIHYTKALKEKGDKKLNIFLRKLEKQETIGDNWTTDIKGGAFIGFDWKTIIETKEDYNNFWPQLKEYLKETKEKNPVKRTKK